MTQRPQEPCTSFLRQFVIEGNITFSIAVADSSFMCAYNSGVGCPGAQCMQKKHWVCFMREWTVSGWPNRAIRDDGISQIKNFFNKTFLQQCFISIHMSNHLWYVSQKFQHFKIDAQENCKLNRDGSIWCVNFPLIVLWCSKSGFRQCFPPTCTRAKLCSTPLKLAKTPHGLRKWRRGNWFASFSATGFTVVVFLFAHFYQWIKSGVQKGTMMVHLPSDPDHRKGCAFSMKNVWPRDNVCTDPNLAKQEHE